MMTQEFNELKIGEKVFLKEGLEIQSGEVNDFCPLRKPMVFNGERTVLLKKKLKQGEFVYLSNYYWYRPSMLTINKS